VARAAPAPADIIIIDRPDPPTSIVAPNQNLRTTIPLKRADQQPLRRPGGSSRSLCSAQPRPMRLGLPARPPLARARVRAANMVNCWHHVSAAEFWRSLSMTPYVAPRRRPPTSSSVAPTARAPSSPRPGITKKKIGRRRRRRPHQRAASSRCTAQHTAETAARPTGSTCTPPRSQQLAEGGRRLHPSIAPKARAPSSPRTGISLK
jgi:hypothetical protein